jgi:hypothetical protein
MSRPRNNLASLNSDLDMPEPKPGDRMLELQQEVQTLQKQIRALANQYPAGARDLKTAESSLSSASQAILASLDEASGEFSELPPLP